MAAKKDQKQWIATARKLFTDDKGKLLRGIDKSKTPDHLLNALGVFIESTDEFTWYRLYNQSRITLNSLCKELNCAGEIAGGMSRSPVCYFIARKGNKNEQAYILSNKLNNTIGRLKVVQTVGQNVMDTKKLSAAVKLLEKTQEDLKSKVQAYLF